jgi:hypothetical protein
LGKKEKTQVPDAKDHLLWAAELLDPAEHLIGILETSDRGVVVCGDRPESGRRGGGAMKASMPYQQAHRRTTAVRAVGFEELK